MTNLKPDISTLFERIIKNDDQQAFEQLFHQYYDVLCGFATRLLMDKTQAEEAVADVFVRIWDRRKEMKVNGSPKSFLFTCVRNQSIDRIRKRSNQRFDFDAFDLELKNEDYTPEQVMQFEELSEKVQRGIDGLPEQCRKIFLMSREEQFTYQEIADKLGLSLKTVKTQMYRAVKKLRAGLGENEGMVLFLLGGCKEATELLRYTNKEY